MISVEEVSGIAFPFRFGGNGGVVLARGRDKIKANLINIVTTSVNERAMEPSAGTVAYAELFRSAGLASRSGIAALIRRAIMGNEPRVDVKNVVVKSDSSVQEGALIATITYQIKENAVREVLELQLKGSS